METKKSLLVVLAISLGVSSVVTAEETKKAKTSSSGSATATATATKNKKKVSIDFEDEVIKGNNDSPEVLFLNSRRLVKYKDLFNRRTNFIEEIESTRGLFNDYKK